MTREETIKSGRLLVEIDITTVCNLSCNNCNRFSQYPSTYTSLSIPDILKFIADNMHYGTDLTVAILGGEPTLHPNIDEIIELLDDHFNVILTTNGINDYTPPRDVVIENSAKEKGEEPLFALTMNAPIDDPQYKDADFYMGCRQSGICGNGYNANGYYPCSVAMNIDRLMFPDNLSGTDTLSEALVLKGITFNKLCRYCGTFQNRHYGVKQPDNLGTEEVISKSWKFMEERNHG